MVKRVVVTMPDECAALLKSYAAQWSMTQSEVLYEACRNHIHAQAKSGCRGTLNLLNIHGIKLDCRAGKNATDMPVGFVSTTKHVVVEFIKKVGNATNVTNIY